MNQFPSRNAQRGATLVVGLILLVLITLMVTAAIKSSTSNLKSVANMQSRNEAIAAANKAIEQTIGSWTFDTPASSDQISVDIDNNGTTDYVVDIAAPVCVRATPIATPEKPLGECHYDLGANPICDDAPIPLFNVIWDIDATATGSSGTRVRVRQGVSLTIPKNKCDAACPAAAGAACA
jgi:PilX N-terminal